MELFVIDAELKFRLISFELEAFEHAQSHCSSPAQSWVDTLIAVKSQVPVSWNGKLTRMDFVLYLDSNVLMLIPDKMGPLVVEATSEAERIRERLVELTLASWSAQKHLLIFSNEASELYHKLENSRHSQLPLAA